MWTFVYSALNHLPNTLPDGGLGFPSAVSPPERTPLKTDGAAFPMRSTHNTNTHSFTYIQVCIT